MPLTTKNHRSTDKRPVSKKRLAEPPEDPVDDENDFGSATDGLTTVLPGDQASGAGPAEILLVQADTASAMAPSEETELVSAAPAVLIELDAVVSASELNDRLDITIRGRAASATPIEEIRLRVDDRVTSAAFYRPPEHAAAAVAPDRGLSEQRAFQFNLPRPRDVRRERCRFELVARVEGGFEYAEAFEIEIDKHAAEPVSVVSGPTGTTAITDSVRPHLVVYIERGTIADDGTLSVQGWAVSLTPVQTVLIYADAKCTSQARSGEDREDVAVAFPAYPDARRSGFSLTVQLDEHDRDVEYVRAQAICANGFRQEETIPVERLRQLTQDPVIRGYSVPAPGGPVQRSQFGGIPYYDIARTRQLRRVGGIALVFFMGLGDYLMATPVIEALHLAHPDLPIYAYTSSTADSVNSPLIIHFLRRNPSITATFTYRGRASTTWKNYDFRDAMKDIPSDFLILPVIYETDPAIWHRVTAITETFSLPVVMPISPPIVPPGALTPAAEAILHAIRGHLKSSKTGPRKKRKQKTTRPPGLEGVVFCHFGARSSGYEYPHADAVIGELLALGFLVVVFSKAQVEHECLIKVDVTSITPNDTIDLLRAVKSSGRPTFIVSVNSVMWPISAALGILNLGIHVFWDGSIHQYLYPNIFVITHHAYPSVSPARLFLVTSHLHVEERRAKSGITFSDYSPEFVKDCFVRMTESRC